MCPINVNAVRCRLRISAASSPSQVSDAITRPRIASAAAAMAAQAGTASSPVMVTMRRSAWSAWGTRKGPHSSGPYGSTISHGAS